MSVLEKYGRTAAASRLYCPTFKTYTEDKVAEHSGQRPKLEINTDDLKPSFVNYRNPQDDKIALAIQEAAKQLKAEGKPLVKN